jgi:hypothetical protein
MTPEVTQLAGSNTRVTFMPDRTAVKVSRFHADCADDVVRAAEIARTRLGDITFGWRGKVATSAGRTAFSFELANNNRTIRQRVVVKRAAILQHIADQEGAA